MGCIDSNDTVINALNDQASTDATAELVLADLLERQGKHEAAWLLRATRDQLLDAIAETHRRFAREAYMNGVPRNRHYFESVNAANWAAAAVRDERERLAGFDTSIERLRAMAVECRAVVGAIAAADAKPC